MKPKIPKVCNVMVRKRKRLFRISILIFITLYAVTITVEWYIRQRSYGNICDNIDVAEDAYEEVTERSFAASENRTVFILGAVAKNSTSGARWDRTAVYGQWYNHEKVKVSDLRCCFKYENELFTETNVFSYGTTKEPGLLQASLVLWHITCDTSAYSRFQISITRKTLCNSTSVTYIDPYYAMQRPEGHIVVTTKIAYDNVKPEIIISFLEMAKWLGIDKVITYVYKTLDPKAKKILRYYASTGLLEYNAITLADNKHFCQVFPPLDGQYRNHEWIVMRDALERSIGSTYFGIFDMDEYLIPSNNRSLKTLLSDLRYRYPQASNFFFKNVHYLTDHVSCTSNCSLFRRHVMTSITRFNDIHRKMFLLPSRVDTKTINNHYVKPLMGYHEVTCPEKDAYVRHYGRCIRKFTQNVCSNKSNLVIDTSMVNWSERTVRHAIQKTIELTD